MTLSLPLKRQDITQKFYKRGKEKHFFLITLHNDKSTVTKVLENTCRGEYTFLSVHIFRAEKLV